MEHSSINAPKKMKTLNLLKQAALLIIVSCCFSSCPMLGHEPTSVGYNLLLNYTDIDGNDLVKELVEVDTISVDRLYKLEIVIPEPCEYRYGGSSKIKSRETFSPDPFGLLLINDHYYCGAYFYLPVDGCPQTRMITHKVKCPELFGDDDIREIMSWWDIPKGENGTHYAKCYLIEFEGNVIIPTPKDKYEEVYIATITLNNPNPPPPREGN
jgi:hypothetical protein